MKVLLYGIARQRLLLPSGSWLDLRPEKEWRRLVSSLRKHVPLTRPPLLRNHRDGTAMGRVLEVVGPVSREQLIRGGVPESHVPHPEYVLFRATLNQRGKADPDIMMTSIGLGFDVADDTGRVWPYFLEELSVVDRPHVRVQPDAPTLSRVALRAGARRTVRLSGGVINREVQMTTGEKQSIKDALLAVVALLGDDSAEDMAVETAEEVTEVLGGDYDEKEELSALRSKVERLEAERAKERIDLAAQKLAVQIDKAGIQCSEEDRKALIEACLAAPDRADTLIRLAAPKAGTARLAAGGGVKAPAETLQARSVQALREAAAAAAAGGAA